MLNGILLIDKEKDITSYDVIRKLKKLLPRKYKIGHAGTLDPFATGLLVILVGKATKLMNDIHNSSKVYQTVAEFGYSTDTQDVTGEKIDTVNISSPIPQEQILNCIGEQFLGDILQTPPMYSAKKVNGKKAYDLARKGIEVELKPKEINVKRFEILEYDWPIVKFEIECSTGTYIRTLVNDLGKELESLATAKELRRMSISKWSVDDAVSSSEISEDFNIDSYLIDIDKVKEDIANE